MNASKAKELLLPIAKEDFLTKEFSNGVNKCCAVGHLVRLTSKEPTNFSVDNCEDIVTIFGDVKQGAEVAFDFCRTKTSEFLVNTHGIGGVNLANVNNRPNVNGYTQDEPKDRVIALLDDMIEAGY